MLANDVKPVVFSVAMDGTDHDQCLQQQGHCKTIGFIIENKCSDNTHLNVFIEYAENFTFEEPCAENANNSHFQCSITVSGQRDVRKPRIKFLNNDFAPNCNIFQKITPSFKRNGNRDSWTCNGDYHSNDRTWKLNLKHLVVISLQLDLNGQPVISAEDVDFINFRLSANALSITQCHLQLKSCSFSLTENGQLNTTQGLGHIQLSQCLCLFFRVENSSLLHAVMDLSFLYFCDIQLRNVSSGDSMKSLSGVVSVSIQQVELLDEVERGYPQSTILVQNAAFHKNLILGHIFQIDLNDWANPESVVTFEGCVSTESSGFLNYTVSPWMSRSSERVSSAHNLLVSDLSITGHADALHVIVISNKVAGSAVFSQCRFSDNLGSLIALEVSGVFIQVIESNFTNNTGTMGVCLNTWVEHPRHAFTEIGTTNQTNHTDLVFEMKANHASLMQIQNCTFVNNKATESGGAIVIGLRKTDSLADSGYLTLTVEFKDSLFKNNSATISGGAIYTESNAQLAEPMRKPEMEIVVVGCLFVNNSAASGEALRVQDVFLSLILKTCVFMGRSSSHHSIFIRGSKVLVNSLWSNSSFKHTSVHLDTPIENMTIRGCIFHEYHQRGDFRTVLAFHGERMVGLALQNTIFMNNECSSFYSGIVKVKIPSQRRNTIHIVINIQNCSVVGNAGYWGIFLFETSCSTNDEFVHVSLQGSLFRTNSASDYRAATVTVKHKCYSGDLSTYHRVEVTNCTFLQNNGMSGAILYEARQGTFHLSLANSQFSQNRGRDEGALSLVVERSSLCLTLVDSNFSGNTGGDAGVIRLTGRQLFLVSNVISSQFLDSSGHSWGTVYFQVSIGELIVVVADCLFKGNKGRYHGGIYLAGFATVLDVNVTESQFVENTGLSGGAIYIDADCPSHAVTSRLFLSSSQFVENMARRSGSAVAVEFSCRQNITGLLVVLSDVDFSHNVVTDESLSKDGGAFHCSAGVQPSRTEIRVQHCKWDNNTSYSYGGALALYLFESSSIKIKHTEYVSNKAAGSTTSKGGACFFGIFKVHEKFAMTSLIQLKDCVFRNNIASIGGSVFQSETLQLQTKMEIEQTTFFCCSHVVSDFMAVTMLSHLKNTHFYCMSPTDDTTVPGLFLRPQGPHRLDNVFFSCYLRDISVSMNKIDILHDIDAAQKANQSDAELTFLSTSCNKCTVKPFPAGNGSLRLNEKTQNLENHKHYVFKHIFEMNNPCEPCPFGAVCSQGEVKALPNFWGYKEDVSIIFLSCPLKYCCNDIDVLCNSHNSCAPQRTGQLCGQCEIGFSESVMSTQCVPDETCDDWWVWPLSIILALLYLMWYMYKGCIANGFKHLFMRFCTCRNHKLCAVEHASSTGDNRSHENLGNDENAYFDILVYFTNIISLIKVQVEFQVSGSSSGFLYDVEKYFLKYLDVDMQQTLNIQVCPVPGINAMHKAMFRPMFTLVIFLVWTLLFLTTCTLLCALTGTHLTFVHLLKKQLKLFKLKLLEGYIETAKYSYSGFAGATFTLLTCIQIGNKQFWKHNAEVECYSTPQKLVMFFAAFHTIPFVLVSPISGKLLKAGTIGHIQVLFACLFPLPFVVFWAAQSFVFLATSKRNALVSGANQHEQRGNREAESQTTSVSEEAEVLLDTYQGMYKEKYAYWEGVVEMRKLIFCSFYLIPNNIVRLLFCTFGCVFFVIHHKSVYPFKHGNSNKIETLSLSLLCVACVTNSVKSVFPELGILVEANTPTEQLLFLLNRVDVLLTFILLSSVVLTELLGSLRRIIHKKHN